MDTLSPPIATTPCVKRGSETFFTNDYLTPAAYAANLTATCDRLRNPDQLRRSHVAPTAPHGVKFAEALITAG